jgi:hypothetical protein
MNGNSERWLAFSNRKMPVDVYRVLPVGGRAKRPAGVMFNRRQFTLV